MITTNITIGQVLQDIADKKSSCIFYSAETLWWTHLEVDLESATVLGKIARHATYNAILEEPNTPQIIVKKLRHYLDQDFTNQIPMDPSGSPLYRHDSPELWMREAISSPGHYGRHGLDAFILTHHKNSLTMFKTWAAVNAKIDQIISSN